VKPWLQCRFPAGVVPSHVHRPAPFLFVPTLSLSRHRTGAIGWWTDVATGRVGAKLRQHMGLTVISRRKLIGTSESLILGEIGLRIRSNATT
jgi:hypothetical protein